MTSRYPEPVPGPEAFASNSRDARLSQAAVVLSVGAAAAGEPHRVDSPAELGLNADVAALGRTRLIPVAEAVAPLDELTAGGDAGARAAVRRPGPVTGPTAETALMTRLADRPDPVTAAALVESSLRSGSRLVRTSAAVAALDTTGLRDDVLAQLVDGASRGGPLAREIGRIGLARVDPEHPVLRGVVGRPSSLTPTAGPADVALNNAVLTHGTFAAMTRWWQPGGDFYAYLDSLVPALHLHDPSFKWSGLYSDDGRQLAAQQFAEWVAAQGLARPDVFAHSHGGTVATLATRHGLEIERLVLLSWPVHGEWFPDFDRIGRIIDVRVRMDLVIIADRGGQTFTPPPAVAAKVTSHVNGWFQHEAPHEPEYWREHGLAAVL